MAIRSFLHAGLKEFATQGNVSGINVCHVARLNSLLAQLSLSAGNMKALRSFPGFHPVKKQFQSNTYSVRVSASCRLTFKVDDSGVIFDVDYVQYH